MLDLATFAAAYAMFHATHGIADYWVQRDWQAQNKSKKGLFEGNFAVWSHAIEYGLCFLPALVFLRGLDHPQKAAIALLAIIIPHAWMDTRWFLMWFCHKTKGWNQGDLDWGVDLKNGKIDDAAATDKVDAAGNHRGRLTIPESHFYKAAVRVHVTIHMDQKFHYASLLAVAFFVAWR